MAGRFRGDLAFVVVMLALQALAGAGLLDRQAQKAVLTPPPDADAAVAGALGDAELFARSAMLKLLNLGRGGGQLVPMRELDYADLSGWFRLVDRLDPLNQTVPSLAGYWYGLTPNRPDSRFVIEYLMERAARDQENGWRWRVQAMYLAKHRLGDVELALAIARDLAETEDPNAPYWVRHMPAFMLEALGEREAALILLVNILESKPDITPGEREALALAIERLTAEPSGEGS